MIGVARQPYHKMPLSTACRTNSHLFIALVIRLSVETGNIHGYQ